jgi:hypothetical protein
LLGPTVVDGSSFLLFKHSEHAKYSQKYKPEEQRHYVANSSFCHFYSNQLRQLIGLHALSIVGPRQEEELFMSGSRDVAQVAHQGTAIF